jgi:hypothetical protein
MYTGTAYIITCIIPKPATNRRQSAARRSRWWTASARARSYGPQDLGELQARRIPAHARAPGGVVDGDVGNAGETADHLLVQPDAG